MQEKWGHRLMLTTTILLIFDFTSQIWSNDCMNDVWILRCLSWKSKTETAKENSPAYIIASKMTKLRVFSNFGFACCAVVQLTENIQG